MDAMLQKDDKLIMCCFPRQFVANYTNNYKTLLIEVHLVR